ncbi:hypothetical protein MUB24_05015 [Lederbergia sp. NSJ-179]|uniref:hypothetical protein n=1 Tax=Lederbergia sp. NSJ-179 TaxID=2931402 RepID=UPI001FD43D42|nr:hypothetical protein [Lederbergia sp. NSJ-179]MCJ7840284.1 hypothetical protein [Lederbergia sp. NSJ-179]
MSKVRTYVLFFLPSVWVTIDTSLQKDDLISHTSQIGSGLGMFVLLSMAQRMIPSQKERFTNVFLMGRLGFRSIQVGWINNAIKETIPNQYFLI